MDPVQAAEAALPTNPLTELKIAGIVLLAATLFIAGMVFQHGRDQTVIDKLNQQVGADKHALDSFQAAVKQQNDSITALQLAGQQREQNIADALTRSRAETDVWRKRAQRVASEPVKPGAQGCLDQSAAFDAELRRERGLQ